jgi:hypothetical protein
VSLYFVIPHSPLSIPYSHSTQIISDRAEH